MRKSINFDFNLSEAIIFSIIWLLLLSITLGLAGPLFIIYLVKFITDRTTIES